uniref:Uncharacterized protein n=1 Tax=Pipistrellus kuhlii TaxID=59472 RepID=A0A7J8A8J3_PIPKU|nr:hypothetical protein mPipKuh1_009056 [Pipistrellus kuhlii]
MAGKAPGAEHHLVPGDSLRVPGSSGESRGVGVRGAPHRKETSDVSALQEAPQKCFKRFARTRPWGTGDLPGPFTPPFPRGTSTALSPATGLSCHPPSPTHPEEAWGPQPPCAAGPVPRGPHVLAHVCACLCVSVAVS